MQHCMYRNFFVFSLTIVEQQSLMSVEISIYVNVVTSLENDVSSGDCRSKNKLTYVFI